MAGPVRLKVGHARLPLLLVAQASQSGVHLMDANG